MQVSGQGTQYLPQTMQCFHCQRIETPGKLCEAVRIKVSAQGEQAISVCAVVRSDQDEPGLLLKWQAKGRLHSDGQ